MNNPRIKNSVLMQRARESLSGKWGLAVGVTAMYLFMSMIPWGLKGVVGSLFSLIISGPLIVGTNIFSLSISRNQNAHFEQLFWGFKKLGRAIVAYLLISWFTLLWLLLFIIPGIIAGISYSQTFLILADDETISGSEAIKKSKKMMQGYKWKFFCLELRFIGWGLLSILTLGIGFLWLIPYMQVSFAKFYDEVKGV